MESLKFIVEFRKHLRDNLEDDLSKYGYAKFFDNETTADENKKDVFMLGYKADSEIEVYQDDWRDYIEYFKLKIDGKELLMLDIRKYDSINAAYDKLLNELKSRI